MPGSAAGQQRSPAETEAASSVDTLERGLDWQIVPLVAYTPETDWMGVVAAFLTYRTEADATYRASSLSIAVQGTLNEQFAVGLYPEIYLDSNRIRIEGSIETMLYPFKFFGIGNSNPSSNAELYTPFGVRIQLRNLYAISGRHVQHGLSGGLRLDVRHDDIRSIDLREDGTAGPLRQGQVTGYQGGWNNGIGPMLSYDTRDNNFDSRSGLFCEGAVVVYDSWLGSDFTWTQSIVDLRAYMPIVSTASFAARVMFQNVAGTPTFQMWPGIGGTNHLRGVFESQQRDRISIYSSAEVRFPIVWIIRGAAFMDMGEVAPSMDQFTMRGVWFSYGGGLRFLLDPAERVSLRFDIGVARGVPQYYLSFNEAF